MVAVEPLSAIHQTMKPELLDLTRQSLEIALMEWAGQHEGPIAQEYIMLLVARGEVLEALDCVATSMVQKKSLFSDNPSCLIWAAWMNFQESGTPGFPLTSALLTRNNAGVKND